MSMIYDREKGVHYEEKQYGGNALKFLYGNKFGRVLLRIAVSPSFSKLTGAYYSSPLSKRKIKPFIEKHGIALDDYEKKEYRSFNDFFTRKKVVKPCFKKTDFISPADSKLTVYKIGDDLSIRVKNCVYTIGELLGRNGVLENFYGGYCFVFRLSMDDCHRYCFVDDGAVEAKYLIRGKLHTVSSISESRKVFCENTRQVNVLSTENFGKIVVVEVGAMLVGKFRDNGKTVFKKGEEKGFFELGGSTIVVLTDGSVKIDDDILEQSKKGIETRVKYAERIGEKNA